MQPQMEDQPELSTRELMARILKDVKLAPRQRALVERIAELASDSGVGDSGKPNWIIEVGPGLDSCPACGRKF